MAAPPRRKSDPLAPPEGGWPLHPLGTHQDRLDVAEWIWSLPELEPSRYSIDSAASVERVIYGLSIDLINDLNNRDMLPTKREHIERLLELSATARKLQRQLEYFAGPSGLLRLVALRSAFFHHDPPRRLPHLPNLIDWDMILAKPLSILVELADEEAGDIAKAAEGSGHQRLHDRLFGDPRLVFAIRAASILAQFCGNPAVKSTEGGAVHTLMNRVWLLATGLDPEDYNLAAFLKKGVRAWRAGKPMHDRRQLKTVRNRLEKRRLRA